MRQASAVSGDGAPSAFAMSTSPATAAGDRHSGSPLPAVSETATRLCRRQL